jgi:hypothetical protein
MTVHLEKGAKMTVDVRPITIGPRNAEQMTGHTWRWLRDHAAELGVEIISINRKRVILGDALLAALAARSTRTVKPEPEVDVRDEIAEMRRRIARAG